MQEFFKTLYLNHKHFWTPKNLALFLYALLFFMFALMIQHVAYNYIDNHASVTPVGDLLLNNLPTINLDFFIVQGALLSTLIILLVLLKNPSYLPFAIKTLALFLIIRSFFISLTHLGVNLHQLALNPDSFGFGAYNFLYSGTNDFFFSGHTGASFLFALIFWNKVFWRYFFFIASSIFGTSMILAHMHYSIDVFAAPFITYSIFIIAKHTFKVDLQAIT